MTELNSPIFISLPSFGASEVRRHEQLWFAKLAMAAGADGVEVRGELLNDPNRELQEIAQATPKLDRVFSSPRPLYDGNGALDQDALEQDLIFCQLMLTRKLKKSIGAGAMASTASLRTLGLLLHDAKVELLIENDQSAEAGTIDPLLRFFSEADGIGLNIPMTFDIGNWHWTGECPLSAASDFSGRVRYVHCKGVQRQPQRWVAVAPSESAAPWRTILRRMPTGVPWAIEYPLSGDDLLSVTKCEIAQLREVVRNFQI